MHGEYAYRRHLRIKLAAYLAEHFSGGISLEFIVDAGALSSDRPLVDPEFLLKVHQAQKWLMALQ